MNEAFRLIPGASLKPVFLSDFKRPNNIRAKSKVLAEALFFYTHLLKGIPWKQAKIWHTSAITFTKNQMQNFSKHYFKCQHVCSPIEKKEVSSIRTPVSMQGRLKRTETILIHFLNRRWLGRTETNLIHFKWSSVLINIEKKVISLAFNSL